MKSFDKKAFKSEIAQKLTTTDSTSYMNFENTFIDIFDKQAPTEEKTLRANHKLYVSKCMRQAIIKRSELASQYCKKPTEENNKAFKKQKNYCNRLYKRKRCKYYKNWISRT